MLYFSKLKIAAVTLVCLAAFYFALPSFIAKDHFLTKFLPTNKVNLGLDLKGGSQLMLEVDFDYYISEQIKNLKDELRNEFRDESIRATVESADNKITFKVFDEDQEKLAKKTAQKVSKKIDIEKVGDEFVATFSSYEIDLMRKNLIQQSIEIIRRRVDESGTKEPTIQAQGKNRILLQVPGVENSEEIKSILGKTAKMTFHFVADETFSGAQPSSIDPRLSAVMDDGGRTYLIEKDVALSGDLLTDANPTYHEGEPAVSFRFNAKGTRKFAKITSENIGKVFAIVLDGKVVTAPRINSIINQGSGVISGNFTTKETADVALLLRAGALPAPLNILEERSVGPSLGMDSIKSGALASVAGLVLVALLMVLFYGSFGLIADLALVVNIAMIFAILSLIGATLTLPGIAGIALTMGMSVDANVLIFERIKEELREKKSTLMALEQGFSQAFRTIIDANITTLIIALFLYVFGNGPVKGFAVALSIGIISSMFCAILLTRMIISLKVKRNKSQKLSLI